MMTTEITDFEQVELVKCALGAMRRFNLDGIEPDVRLRAIRGMGYDLAAELNAFVWAEESAPISYVYRWPADWWQAFKQRFFPAWLRRAYPPRFVEVSETIECKRFYPQFKLSVPPNQYRTRLFRQTQKHDIPFFPPTR